MTDKERIKKYLLYKGISKNKFYEQTGFSTGFLDSGNSLGVDKARIIINKYPDINIEWLIMGTGEMINNLSDSLKAIYTNSQSKTIFENNSEAECAINQLLTVIKEQVPKIAPSSYPITAIIERKDEEIKELYKQVGRLEAENEHLQTEIESLRRENNILKKSMSTPDAEDADFAAANG